MHCTTPGWASSIDSGVPSVFWNCALWWPWTPYGGNMEKGELWASNVELLQYLKARQRGRSYWEREKEGERERKRSSKEWKQKSREWCQWKQRKRRLQGSSGHQGQMLLRNLMRWGVDTRSISSLGGLCESCFSGVIRPDWNELGEWVGGEEM